MIKIKAKAPRNEKKNEPFHFDIFVIDRVDDINGVLTVTAKHFIERIEIEM